MRVSIEKLASCLADFKHDKERPATMTPQCGEPLPQAKPAHEENLKTISM